MSAIEPGSASLACSRPTSSSSERPIIFAGDQPKIRPAPLLAVSMVPSSATVRMPSITEFMIARRRRSPSSSARRRRFSSVMSL
jgi:hypothetical protein